jgi:hypothetical protein
MVGHGPAVSLVLRRDLDQLLADAEASATSTSQRGAYAGQERRGVAQRPGVLGRPVALFSTTLDNLYYVKLPANWLVLARRTRQTRL